MKQLTLLIAIVALLAGCEKPEQPQPTLNGYTHWQITTDTTVDVDYSFQFTDNSGTRVIQANSREPLTLDLLAGGSYRIEWRTTTAHINAYILWNTSVSNVGWTRSTTIPATTF